MAKEKKPEEITLPSPALHFPKSEEIVDGNAVTFVWEPVEDATIYILQIASDSTFEDCIFEDEITDRTAFTVSNIFPPDGDLFYWRVLTGNESGWSNGDTIESFIIGSPELVAQHIFSPNERFGPYSELIKGAVVEAAAEFSGSDLYTEREESHGVERDRVEAGQIVGISLAIVFALVTAIIVLFQWFTVRQESTITTALNQADYPELREVVSNATEKLTQFGVIDEQAGVYRIPIDRAMELMVNEAYQNQNVENYPELP